MQGYQRPTLKLVWPEDSEFHGLEVRVRRLSIGDLFDIADIEKDVARDGNAAVLESLVRKVAKMLISWNLLDEAEQEVSADEKGLRYADPGLLYAIIGATSTAMAGVTPPLPRPSGDGGTFPEASIPMESLSPNPPTSPEPD